MQILKKEPTFLFGELFHDTTVLPQFESPFSDVTAAIRKVTQVLCV